MPRVQKQTAKQRRYRRAGMSAVRKSTLRVDRTSVEQKLSIIRVLYFITYNGRESLIPQAVELFHTIGEILEGVPPEDLSLHRINKQALLRELALID
jgi:hypothetical protein